MNISSIGLSFALLDRRYSIIFLLWAGPFLDCHAQTFFKTLGLEGSDESGQCIAATADGNYAIGGMKGDSAMVSKVDPDGNLIWSRCFQAVSGFQNVVYQIASTPDGNLVGTGNGYASNPFPEFTFLFKLDLAGTLIWQTTSDDDRPIWTNRIMPNTDSEYMVLPCIYDLNSLTLSDLYTGMVDANTGLMLFNNPRTDFTPANPGLDENYSAVIAPDQSIYACGRVFMFGDAVESMRPHVTHYSPSGARLWSKYFMYPVTETARIYAIDIILNEDSLTVCYFGDIDGPTSNYNAGLIRMDTLGNVAWTKDYNVSGYTSDLSYKVLRMPYGYAITGYGIAADRDLFVIALDLNGNVLWANSYGTAGSAEFLQRTVTPNAVAIGSDILMTAIQETAGDRNIIIARIDETGNATCTITTPVDVVVTDVPPFADNLAPVEYPDPIPFVAASVDTSIELPYDICNTITVDLGPDTAICSPYSLDAFIPNATYFWSTGSTSSSVEIVGPDTVWVTIYMNCCELTDTVIITSGPFPTAAMINVVPECGYAVEFTDASTNATFTEWLFGDGETAVGSVVEHTYSTSGQFDVSIVASNDCGTDTLTETIIIIDGGNLELLGPDIVCEGSAATISILLSDDVVTDQTWSTGITTSSEITIDLLSDTTIWVDVLGASGCAYSDTLSISPTPLPTAQFTFVAQECATTVQFNSTALGEDEVSWQFGNGGTSTAPDPTAIFDTGGIYDVLFIATNSCGSDSATAQIESIPQGELVVSNDTLVCEGIDIELSIDLLGASIGTVQWSTGEQDLTTISRIATGTETVLVEVTDESGCSYSGTIAIGTVPGPIAEFQFIANPCDSSVTFMNYSSDPLSSIWEFGEGPPSVESDPVVSYLTTGPYLVSLMVNNNCGADTVYQFVSIPSAPGFSILGPERVCDATPIELQVEYTGSGTVDMLWSTGDTTETITIEPTEGAVVEISGVDDQGCQLYSAYRVRFAGDDNISSSYIPNTFTPNGDGFNEFFSPVIQDGFISMYIFNRWGEEIYATTDLTKPWLGDYKEDPVPDGTYIYLVRWKDLCAGKTEERIGHVTLLR